MPAAQVITLASPTTIPEGNVVGFDDDNDTPLVIAYTAPPAASGAVVVEVLDTAPPPGGGGGGTSGPGSYRHSQIVPAVTWTIPHNLGYRPSGIVAKEGSSIIEPSDVQYPDLNTCVLYWSNIPVSGTVDLS